MQIFQLNMAVKNVQLVNHPIEHHVT